MEMTLWEERSRRAMKNFLELYDEYCGSTEVPSLFSFWCGVGAISAALGRNSFIQFGQFPIYPNFYILLVAGSGTYRKSTSVDIAESIVRGIQPIPKMIPRSSTPQGLMDELQKIEVENMTALFSQNGTGFLCCDEFKAFLNKKSYDMGLGTLLIDLYNCKDIVDYKTMARGKETVKNACLTILGASTLDWLKDAIPVEAVGGGLTSRMLFILYDGDIKDVAWPDFDLRLQRIKTELIETLQMISTIQGEFTLEPDAKNLCMNEYIRFKHEQGVVMGCDQFLAGYASRRQLHQLKLSMVFSASERLDKIITLNHMIGATNCLVLLEKKLPDVMKKITASAIGSSIDLVMSIMRRFSKGGLIAVTRTQLQRSVAHRFALKEMDDILGTLMMSGMIRQTAIGNAVAYFMGDVTKEGEM